MIIKRALSACVAAGITVAGLAGTGYASAEELRFATGSAHNSLGSRALERFSEAVAEHSDSDLRVRGYVQSLLSFMETPAGLRDGIADLGHVLTPYFPSDFPNTILLTELTMALGQADVGDRDVMFAYNGAVADFVINDCPECLQEHLDRNQIYLGMASTSPYGLACNGAVTSLDDIAGKRIRVAGAQWSRWVESMGGSPVSLPINETYEGLSQGVVDCTASNLSDLLSFKFIEVISDLTMGVPAGTFGGVGTNMNADRWRSLSENDRKTVLYATAMASARILTLYYDDHLEVLKRFDEEENLNLHSPKDDIVNATVEFIEQDIDTVAAHYNDRYGIANGKERLEAFRSRLDEWLQKVEGIDSEEELANLYWDEVFSKVDVTSYGF
ncbi:C4-dicarboxylate TRAP transporter substrate-binding protein [uncultured Marinobacter sp.]|uniref:C4-dicarboxylate TRAP transporter substrate-binding protein n=1 Tax=uncultured Marinobacter sp. TaxID=187379 RepID=UPI0030DBB66D